MNRPLLVLGVLLGLLAPLEMRAVEPTLARWIAQGSVTTGQINRSLSAASLGGSFYSQRAWRTAWQNAAGPSPQFRQLLQAIGAAGDHGLDPLEYHYEVLVSLAREAAATSWSVEEGLALDLLATDALTSAPFSMPSVERSEQSSLPFPSFPPFRFRRTTG